MSMDCIPSETLATLGYQREGPAASAVGGVARSATVSEGIQSMLKKQTNGDIME